MVSTTTEVGSVDSVDSADFSEEHWVFQRFFDEIARDVDGADSLSLRKYQKLFRERYANFLEWYHHLRRNSIHKKIIDTIRELEGGSGGYDQREDVYASVIE